MLGRGPSKVVAALGLTVLTWGCNNSAATPASPLAPTPTPIPVSAPSPRPGGIASSVLSGIVYEITSTGRTPVEGATIHLETCSLDNCPDVKAYNVRTDKQGEYRISGVYDGTLNFFWATDAVYEMADPMPLGTCPDACDRVVTVSGDTRLDIELRRR
jgi:hypothetical protein